MSYNKLEYHFKLLWGKPFQGKRSAQSEHDLAFRRKMALKPLEERKLISDEEYERLERAHHNNFKQRS